MIKPIKKKDPCTCIDCGEKSLIVHTINKAIINYDVIYNDPKRLDKIEISHIYCHKCKKSYIIDWVMGYPRQCITRIF